MGRSAGDASYAFHTSLGRLFGLANDLGDEPSNSPVACCQISCRSPLYISSRYRRDPVWILLKGMVVANHLPHPQEKGKVHGSFRTVGVLGEELFLSPGQLIGVNRTLYQ